MIAEANKALVLFVLSPLIITGVCFSGNYKGADVQRSLVSS